MKIIKITEGVHWYEGLEGKMFEVDEMGVGDGDDPNATIYYVDPPEYADLSCGRRFVSEHNCEVISESDVVDSPQHYTQGGVEVIDIIAQTVSGYDDPFVAHCVGTATKYLNRAPYKHAEPTEDLRKAKRYIEFAIDHLTKEDD